MQSAVGDEIGFAVAFLAIDDPRQVNARLAHEVAAELDEQFGVGQRVGQIAETLFQRGSDSRNIQRFVAREIGNTETAPHVELGQRDPGVDRDAMRAVEHLGLHVDHRFSRECLAAGEDVQAAKVASRGGDVPDQRGDPRGVDPEGLGPAAHLHPRSLELEIGIDANREARRHAKSLGDGQRAARFGLAFEIERDARGDRGFEFQVALARPGEAHPAQVEPGRPNQFQLAARRDIEPVGQR